MKNESETPEDAEWSFSVWRQDDHGSRFRVSGGHTHEQALRLVAEYEAKGHKQTYWVEPEQE